MGPLFTYSVITLLLASIIGCKGVSKYTIDDHPITETDSGLYGIWKLVEDTSNANFFLVQSPYGLFHLQIGGAIWTVRQKEHFLMKVT